MSLSIGIVGLPNVGKSTLFNALLKRQAALAANYPFATIEPNIGVVEVPDPRLSQLVKLVQEEYGLKQGNRDIPERVVPAVVKFYDIAGLVKGASQGEGLGNQFLGHIREVDAILHVVRAFTDENVVRAGSVDPINDIATVNTELILADLATLEKRISTLEKDAKKDKSTKTMQMMDLYNKTLDILNESKLASTAVETDADREILREAGLLTAKPVVYVYNIDETLLGKDLPQYLGLGPQNVVPISAKMEEELSSLADSDREVYLHEVGVTESGLDKVIRLGYSILGLETYFTAGPKEVRAWTYLKGSRAPQAAGIIHTDFERGFISAEVISVANLIASGGWKKAKEKGLLRLEGKTYVMHDGDVAEFNFSV